MEEEIKDDGRWETASLGGSPNYASFTLTWPFSMNLDRIHRASTLTFLPRQTPSTSKIITRGRWEFNLWLPLPSPKWGKLLLGNFRWDNLWEEGLRGRRKWFIPSSSFMSSIDMFSIPSSAQITNTRRKENTSGGKRPSLAYSLHFTRWKLKMENCQVESGTPWMGIHLSQFLSPGNLPLRQAQGIPIKYFFLPLD